LLTLLLTRLVTGKRVLFSIDDSPTKSYGPQVQGAGIHRNPTPGSAGQKYLYGHTAGNKTHSRFFPKIPPAPSKVLTIW